MTKLLIALLLISNVAIAQDWESSPNNWSNSPNNWENSSSNWNNSPNNWENSPNNWGNERIIRGENGNAQGYAVPRADGGVNFYDGNGNRTGYLPKR
jgi:hypothetical protein